MVIKVFGDSPISDQRFADLSKGKMGVGYRRSKVDSVNEVSANTYHGPIKANIYPSELALEIAVCQVQYRIKNCMYLLRLGFLQSFIRFDGVSSLTYSSSQESPISGGEDIFKLEVMLTDIHPMSSISVLKLMIASFSEITTS